MKYLLSTDQESKDSYSHQVQILQKQQIEDKIKDGLSMN